MRPLCELPHEDLLKIEFILTDIDDTLTTDGILPAKSYHALEKLHQSGFKVIPITGRPAGWCDHIARMWPVDACLLYTSPSPRDATLSRMASCG